MMHNGKVLDKIEGVWMREDFSKKHLKSLIRQNRSLLRAVCLESKLKKSDLKSKLILIPYLDQSLLQQIPNEVRSKFLNWIKNPTNNQLEPVSDVQTSKGYSVIVCRVRVDDSPWRLEFSAWSYKNFSNYIILDFRKVINKAVDQYSTSVFEWKTGNPKDAADHLEKLHDKVYSRLQGYKIKSRLNKKKTKSVVPGFGYYFKK